MTKSAAFSLPWHDEIQRIRLATFARGIRLVGFTSPRKQSGVTVLCRNLAAATAASGVRTLLVDLSEPLRAADEMPAWLPGSGAATVAIPPSREAFHRLTATASAENSDLFNNSAQLRRTLMDELSDYAAVIVDIAPVLASYPSIHATSAAVACGNVYLVCVANDVTKTDVLESVERLNSAGVEVLGLILNDVANPTLGAELAREVLRFKRFAPQWAERCVQKLRSNPFLN